jgi:CheY-like chemotaxis protein
VPKHRSTQRIAIKMVTTLGYRVHTAENGVEARRKARTRRYDVILMDCQMPEMDDYDLVSPTPAPPRSGTR